MFTISCPPKVIWLGRKGENEFRRIEVEVSEWLRDYPNGTISVVYHRPDGAIYLPSVTTNGNVTSWLVTATDTAIAGKGEVEYRITDGDIIGKSVKIPTMVSAAINATTDAPAPPPEDWTAVAAEILGMIGDLDNLDTEAKNNLVAAINEIFNSGGGGGSFNIHSLPVENNLADADEMPLYDVSANAQRKTTWQNFKAKLKAYFDTLYIGASALVGYATQAWVEGKGYLTQHQSLAAYRTSAAQDIIDNGKASAASVEAIEAKIPSAASAENQLADKAFVNSTVGTNTAIFRGTFNSVAELEAYSGEKTNNDYAFVITTDVNGNTVYNRYKFNGTSWVYEYSLNNSSFTAAQWAAIQSGITSGEVALIQSALQPGALDDYSLKSDLQDLQSKTITDSAGYFTTDTVEGALAEIGAELAGVNTLLGSGVIT